MGYFEEMEQDYIEFNKNLLIEDLEWSLNESGDKKGIIQRIKDVIKKIADWIGSVWEKFVSKFRKDPDVKKADSGIKSAWARIRGKANSTNENNAESNFEFVEKEARGIRKLARDIMDKVKNRVSIVKAPESVGISDSFYKAVKDKKISLIRIMIKNSMLMDLSFSQCDEMLRIASHVKGLYDEPDGGPLETDRNKWDRSYMNRQLVQLVDNFSHERLNHLKQVIKHVYKDKY